MFFFISSLISNDIVHLFWIALMRLSSDMQNKYSDAHARISTHIPASTENSSKPFQHINGGKSQNEKGNRQQNWKTIFDFCLWHRTIHLNNWSMKRSKNHFIIWETNNKTHIHTKQIVERRKKSWHMHTLHRIFIRYSRLGDFISCYSCSQAIQLPVIVQFLSVCDRLRSVGGWLIYGLIWLLMKLKWAKMKANHSQCS